MRTAQYSISDSMYYFSGIIAEEEEEEKNCYLKINNRGWWINV